MPKKLPKGAFGGMLDKVNSAKRETGRGVPKIQRRIKRVMKHPKFPGTKN